MATLAHAAAGLVIGRVHSNATLTPLRASFVLFSALAVLPDLDVVVGQSLAAIYPAMAHRGIAHSLGAAVAVGMITWLVSRRMNRRWPPRETALAAGIAWASNGLLDVFSAGGEGVALFWPLLDARFVCAWRPIPDAPAESLLTTAHGIRCLTLEAAGCVPAVLWALSGRASRWIPRITTVHPAGEMEAGPSSAEIGHRCWRRNGRDFLRRPRRTHGHAVARSGPPCERAQDLALMETR
jgi:inner membrane protein